MKKFLLLALLAGGLFSLSMPIISKPYYIGLSNHRHGFLARIKVYNSSNKTTKVYYLGWGHPWSTKIKVNSKNDILKIINVYRWASYKRIQTPDIFNNKGLIIHVGHSLRIYQHKNSNSGTSFPDPDQGYYIKGYEVPRLPS